MFDPVQAAINLTTLLFQPPKPLVDRGKMAPHFGKALVVLSQLSLESIELRLEDFLVEIR
jgi:hypothetical protein